AQQRLPWWQRLLPAPAPVSAWGRAGMAFAGAMASLLLAVQFLQQPISTIRVEKPKFTNMASVAQPSFTTRVSRPVKNDGQQPAGLLTPGLGTTVNIADTQHGAGTLGKVAIKPGTVKIAAGPRSPYNPVPVQTAPDLADGAYDAAPQPKNLPEETHYTYAARDAVLTAARDAELSTLEESLSTPPVEVKGKFAEPPARSTAKPSGITPASNSADSGTSVTDQLRLDLKEGYQRRNKPAQPQPIVSHRRNEELSAAGLVVPLR
ncbi:MAG TPA: hypothetical protein VGM23_03070, partial [Armatimonadota bacterium]